MRFFYSVTFCPTTAELEQVASPNRKTKPEDQNWLLFLIGRHYFYYATVPGINVKKDNNNALAIIYFWLWLSEIWTADKHFFYYMS
jgi:hypothetical protein